MGLFCHGLYLTHIHELFPAIYDHLTRFRRVTPAAHLCDLALELFIDGEEMLDLAADVRKDLVEGVDSDRSGGYGSVRR